MQTNLFAKNLRISSFSGISSISEKNQANSAEAKLSNFQDPSKKRVNLTLT